MERRRRVARELARGELWMYAFKSPDKRRPVVILTRQDALPWLSTVMVAPVLSTIRGVPSEVQVGADVGLKRDSVINLDHVQTVAKNRLVKYVGALDAIKMKEVCQALAIATGCGS